MSEERYQILPFFKMEEEVYSLPDIMLVKIWEQLCHEKKNEMLFYNSPKDVGGWLEFVKRPTNHFVFVVDQKKLKIIGGGWLTNIDGHIALSNEFTLGKANHKAGQKVIDYWSSLEMPFLLIGITPSNNPVAVKLAKHFGYTVIGEIPDYCYLAYEESFSAGVISYLDTRRI